MKKTSTDERIEFAKSLQDLFPVTSGATHKDLFAAILAYNDVVEGTRSIPVPPKRDIGKTMKYNRLIVDLQVPPLVKIIKVIHSFGIPVVPNASHANLFTSAMQFAVDDSSEALGGLYVAVIAFLKDILNVTKKEIALVVKAVEK